MKIRLVQMCPELGDKNYNLNKIYKYIDEESDSKIDLIAFPELALTGYMSKSKLYMEKAEPIPGPSTEGLIKKARDKDIYIIIGMPERINDSIYNSAALLGPKGLVGIARKHYLPNFISKKGIKYRERKYFKSGSEIKTFKTGFGKIGIEICYEFWYPEITRIHAIQGANIIINISASPVGVPELFQLLARARALENMVFFAYVNQVGMQGEIAMGGGSCIVDYLSNIKEHASIDDKGTEEILECDLNITELNQHRASLPILKDVRPDIVKKLYDASVNS